MGIKEGALALADELEAFEDGDCEECSLYGQPECKGHLSCMEIMARYAARKMREAVERDGEGATTVSAYDLLPDDDREALAWVREHGGLDMAASRFESGEIAADMLWGKGHGRFWTTDEFEEEISKRLMPADCEWPHFEDGEPVRVGDKLMTSDGAVRVEELSLTICDTDGGVTCVPFGERVKRPDVIASDGEPLEAGQTVYGTRDLEPVEIVSLRSKEYDGVRTVKCKDRTGFVFYAPGDLTHQRPVLDADGVPIKEGDTVYLLPGEWCDRFPCLGFYGGEELNVIDLNPKHGVSGSIKCYKADKMTVLCYPQSSQLTHAKPEPPDSRQAIVNEIGDEMAARIDLLVSSGRWSDAD